ncbi:hypothetical protein [Pleionea sp. CnH1-48]|uniref:hypothetical protein n=1 Tax=Pleionea sp. CnH1-48 TaxID=2954494 RepID=UPI002096A1CF|nr:hypothetical protein [Pleionea sp. CnH1-48]MCO7227113.1 hypothetical protein [Pleionea sp. CnH1-48]
MKASLSSSLSLISLVLGAAISGELKADTATFSVEITAKGEEVVAYENREFTGEFPYFDIRGGHFGGWPSRTESVTYCLPADIMRDCEIDTSRTHSTHTPEGPEYGQGGPGFGIFIDTVNSPGGAQSASYTLNHATGCLTSTVTVRAKRRMRGWYQGRHTIYARCPIKQQWSHTQAKGPFTIDSNDGYQQLAQYDGPIGSGSGIPGTAEVFTNGTGYTANITSSTPAEAPITKGMFNISPQHGVNGPRFFASYEGNDIAARGLEVTQGMQNIYNDMPLVALRRTMARFYVQSTVPTNNVSAELRAFRNGTELPDSPILAENPITVRDAGIDRTLLDHAFLFKIPQHWTTQGEVSFVARVNQNGAQPDSNGNNNQWTENLTFNQAHLDTVVEVPLHLHDGANRDNPLRIYEGSHPHYPAVMGHVVRHHPTTALASFDCGFKPLKPLWHFWPFNKEWNITDRDHWSQILSRMQWKRFWSSCGFTDSFWAGMVHPDLPEAQGGAPAVWGIARGQRVSTSIMFGLHSYTDWNNSNGGNIVSHEIGHNKNLDHVCTANNPANQDTNYPYPDNCGLSLGNSAFFDNGHDGYFGMDVYHDFFGLAQPAILGSDSANVNFPWNRDVSPVMSYRSREWISPYSYCKLLSEQGVYCDRLAIAARYQKPGHKVETLLAEATTETAHEAAYPNPNRAQETSIKEEKHSHAKVTQKLPVLDDGNGEIIQPIDDIIIEEPALDLAQLVISGHFNTSDRTLSNFILMKTEPRKKLILPTLNDRQATTKQALAANLLPVVQLKQYKGTKLLKQNFIMMTRLSEDATVGEYSFMTSLPLALGATKFELVYNNQVITTKQVSTNKPQIQLESIADINMKSNTVLRWNASDADGDNLSYSVFYSADGGISWVLVDSQIANTQYPLNSDTPAGVADPLRYYKGSNKGKFKVTAFDGYHTTSAITTENLLMPGSAPRVSILQQNGLVVHYGKTVYLTGTVSDIEDGPLIIAGSAPSPFTLRWHSNLNGDLGTSSEIRTRSLKVGTHTITLSATDKNGDTGTASIQLVVTRGIPLPVAR